MRCVPAALAALTLVLAACQSQPTVAPGASATQMGQAAPARRRDAQWEMMRRLHRAGVRLLVGSDAGWRYTRFDAVWRELEELVVCGLSPLEAITGATGGAAAAIGRTDEGRVTSSP